MKTDQSITIRGDAKMKYAIKPGAEKCSCCQRITNQEDFTNFQGETVCEGCAETADMMINFDDPHGKNWKP